MDCAFLFYRVTLEFFVRDSNTGKALEPDEVITMINSEEIGISLKQQGFKVERIEKSKYSYCCESLHFSFVFFLFDRLLTITK